MNICTRTAASWQRLNWCTAFDRCPFAEMVFFFLTLDSVELLKQQTDGCEERTKTPSQQNIVDKMMNVE